MIFVVNGEEVVVGASLMTRLDALIDIALLASGNAARPREEWELRHDNGIVIADTSKPAGVYGLTREDRLYLTLRVGALG